MAYQDTPVVDAWMQHPTEEFHNHEMFASLRRWQGDDAVFRDPAGVDDTGIRGRRD